MVYVILDSWAPRLRYVAGAPPLSRKKIRRQNPFLRPTFGASERGAQQLRPMVSVSPFPAYGFVSRYVADAPYVIQDFDRSGAERLGEVHPFLCIQAQRRQGLLVKLKYAALDPRVCEEGPLRPRYRAAS